VSVFKGKTIVVAGADCELGGTIVRALVDLEAVVIVIGRDEVTLNKLAQYRPDRIEPLALNLSRPHSSSLLGATWGRKPLDLLLMLDVAKQDARPKMATLDVQVALIKALIPGLRAAKGALILTSGRQTGLYGAVTESALARLNAGIAKGMRRHGVRSNLIGFENETFDATDFVQVLAFTLAMPTMNGSTLYLSPHSPQT